MIIAKILLNENRRNHLFLSMIIIEYALIRDRNLLIKV
jgi:hypothetical protein